MELITVLLTEVSKLAMKFYSSFAISLIRFLGSKKRSQLARFSINGNKSAVTVSRLTISHAFISGCVSFGYRRILRVLIVACQSNIRPCVIKGVAVFMIYQLRFKKWTIQHSFQYHPMQISSYLPAFPVGGAAHGVVIIPTGTFRRCPLKRAQIRVDSINNRNLSLRELNSDRIGGIIRGSHLLYPFGSHPGVCSARGNFIPAHYTAFAG